MKKNHKKKHRIFFIFGHDVRMYDCFSTIVDHYTTARVVSLKKDGTAGLRSLRRRVCDCLRASDYCVALASADDALESTVQCRQNVIFELGCAIESLGEDHCLLVLDPAVTLPSDLSDVMYIGYNPLDHKEAVKLFLKQLESWGIEIDLNILNLL